MARKTSSSRKSASNEAPVVAMIDTTMPMGENGNELVDPIAADEALMAEMLANEALPASNIDHSSQMSSWAPRVAKDESAENLDAISQMAIEELGDVNEVHSVEAVENQQAERTFEELRTSFDKEALLAKAKQIVGEIDARARFEETKNADNSSIQKTLTSVRKEFTTLRAASVMLAANVDAGMINRTLHDGSRYNVYALGKIADLCRGLSDETVRNAINLACMRSLFICRREGIAFTGEIARACASDKIRIDGKIARHLIRHTVSASTAPTQASSTMQALVTLGVVTASGGKNPVYTLTDNAITKELEKRLMAA